jgi:hypothetical protein
LTTDTLMVDRVRQLAEVLLDRAELDLDPGVDHDQVLAILARLLHRYRPPHDPHGCLMLDALIPRLGHRPPDQVAVRRLLAAGQGPTPAAVAGVARQATEADQAWAAKVARLRPLVDQEGPRAADAVVDLWQQRRKAPSPTLLGRRLGWRPRDALMLTWLLVEAGWLIDTDHRLTPGPKA